MKYHAHLLLLFLLCIEPVLAEDFGINRDNQSWNTVRITAPLDDRWSVSLQNEARFTEDMTNLDEKGTGPVSGFEQVRVAANLGFHIGGYTRFEIGYLYRFERSRGKADLSDNVLHANLLFTTKRKPKPRKPLPNEHFQ